MAVTMWIPAVILAVLCAAVTWVTVPYLRHRSDAMPVPAHPDSERDVLAAVHARPDRAVYLYELTGDQFSNTALGAQWDALYQSVVAVVDDPRNRSDELTDDDLNALAEQARACSADIRARIDAAGAGGEPDQGWASDDRDPQVVAAAADVYADAVERDTMQGAAPLLRTGDGTSIYRQSLVPAPRRAWFSAAAAAGGAVTAAMADAGGYHGLSWWLAVAAGLTLVAVSVAVAWVDLDTLFLDRLTWAVGTVGAWVFVAGATLSAGAGGRLLLGAGAAAAVALLFEGLNLAYRLLRGRPGQGGGDTLIVLATVGVPAALVGNWVVAYWSLMASLLTAIAVWFILAKRSGAGTDTPFAFGPMLALGWVVGVAGWALVGA